MLGYLGIVFLCAWHSLAQFPTGQNHARPSKCLDWSIFLLPGARCRGGLHILECEDSCTSPQTPLLHTRPTPLPLRLRNAMVHEEPFNAKGLGAAAHLGSQSEDVLPQDQRRSPCFSIHRRWCRCVDSMKNYLDYLRSVTGNPE